MASVLTRTKLEKQPYKDLQALAKLHKLKANGSKAAIIARLIEKHPEGVPEERDEDAPPVGSSKIEKTQTTRLRSKTAQKPLSKCAKSETSKTIEADAPDGKLDPDTEPEEESCISPAGFLTGLPADSPASEDSTLKPIDSPGPSTQPRPSLQPLATQILSNTNTDPLPSPPTSPQNPVSEHGTPRPRPSPLPTSPSPAPENHASQLPSPDQSPLPSGFEYDSQDYGSHAYDPYFDEVWAKRYSQATTDGSDVAGHMGASQATVPEDAVFSQGLTDGDEDAGPAKTLPAKERTVSGMLREFCVALVDAGQRPRAPLDSPTDALSAAEIAEIRAVLERIWDGPPENGGASGAEQAVASEAAPAGASDAGPAGVPEKEHTEAAGEEHTASQTTSPPTVIGKRRRFFDVDAETDESYAESTPKRSRYSYSL